LKGDNRSVKGFTLIEILVVFSLIGILTALGFASYSAFNGEQALSSSASDVATMLSSAKSHALTQVVPNSCGTNSITGYQVSISTTTQQYILSVVCGSSYALTTNKLQSQVTFGGSSTTSVFFNMSTGTVTAPATIIVNGYGKTKTIRVSSTGIISVQ